MDPVHFRVATALDVEALLAFWQQAAEDTGRPTDTAQAVHRVLDRDPAAVELAIDVGGTVGAERIVGSLILGWDGWRAHLYRLAVHPQFRRRGLARQLVSRAEGRMRERGVTRMDAMVLDDNPDGHGLWQAMGYRPQPEWSRWVKAL